MTHLSSYEAYLKLKHDIFGVTWKLFWGIYTNAEHLRRSAGGLTQVQPLKFLGNMKVFFGHLGWGLGTKGPHSDPTEKTFLGLCIVSNVSKWSKPLLKIG